MYSIDYNAVKTLEQTNNYFDIQHRIDAIDNSKIGPLHILILSYINKRTGKNKTCWPGYKRIAKDLKLSVRCVIYKIKDLVNFGYLLKIQGLHRSNDYRIIEPKLPTTVHKMSARDKKHPVALSNRVPTLSLAETFSRPSYAPPSMHGVHPNRSVEYIDLNKQHTKTPRMDLKQVEVVVDDEILKLAEQANIPKQEILSTSRQTDIMVIKDSIKVVLESTNVRSPVAVFKAAIRNNWKPSTKGNEMSQANQSRYDSPEVCKARLNIEDGRREQRLNSAQGKTEGRKMFEAWRNRNKPHHGQPIKN